MIPPRVRSATLAAVGALAGRPAATAAQPPVPNRAALVARLDSLATAFVGDGTAAGVTVGVARGRDTLLLRGYGLADTSARRPATASTVYRIGSITTQFTAAAVLQLVEQGRVSLDDSPHEAMARGGDVARRAFEAMMTMRKIDVARIGAAVRREGVPA